MAFNLPFGVRVADNTPVDAERYIAIDIAARDALVVTQRAFEGLQVYVESDQTLYILKGTLNTDWEEIGGGNDAPSDGKQYVRQDESWIEGLIPYTVPDSGFIRAIDNTWVGGLVADGFVGMDAVEYAANEISAMGLALKDLGGTDQSAAILALDGTTITLIDSSNPANVTSGAVATFDGSPGFIAIAATGDHFIFPLGMPANGVNLSIGAETVNEFEVTSTDGSVTVNRTSILGVDIVGLGNVDNTSDINKPISTATQVELDTKINTIGGLTETNNFPTNSARNYEVLTQAEYDGIGSPDANTLYFII